MIREALQQWRQKRLLQLQNIEELRRLCQEGIKSGLGQFADLEEIKSEALRLFHKSSETYSVFHIGEVQHSIAKPVGARSPRLRVYCIHKENAVRFAH